MGTNISTIPLFGRAWKLTVRSVSGSAVDTTEILTQSSWDPEALRMRFDVLESTLPSPFWFADISVYNLTKPEVQNLLLNAVWVTLEAGYQIGPTKASIIWDGPVLQTVFDRENVVDFKVTFHCIASIPLIMNNIVNFAQGPRSTQVNIVSRMVQEIGGPSNLVKMSDKATSLLTAKEYPRGKTVFGKISKYLSQMADDNFISTWMNGNQAFLSEMDSGGPPPGGTLVFSPPNPPGFVSSNDPPNITRSLLGVPQQSPFGVIFNVLLDPRLKVGVPPMLAQLNKAVVAQQKITYGQLPVVLDQNLTFVVGQVRHYGDTRGNDWCTEVTGYNRTYGQGLLRGLFLPDSQGSGASK